jgi:hypothetical protein
MSNYTVKIEGLELLYHLIKNKDMTYKQAIKVMEDNNQDMTFLKDLKLDK